jgi:hypothetical protein
LPDDLAWGRDLAERELAGASPAALLIEDRLAEVNTLAADIYVAGAFDEGADIAVTLSAERAEGVFLDGAAAPASGGEVAS